MKGIKTKLLVFMGMLIGVICLGVGWISFANASKALTSNMGKILPEVAEQTANNIQGKIDRELKYLDSIASREDIMNPNNSWENKKAVLLNEVKRNESLGMGIIDKNGEFMNANGIITNVKNEKYFLDALSGKKNISDPIINTDNKTITFVYAVPIEYNNEITGILIEIIDGNELTKLINQIEFGQTGRAFMIKEDGTTIANLDKELVIQKDNVLENVKNNKKLKSLADILCKMTNKEVGMDEYTYDGFSSLVGYSPVRGTDWSLGIEIEKDEVLSGLNSLKVSITLLSMIFAIIGFIIVYMLSNNIIKGIKLTLKHLELLSYNKLKEEIHSKDLLLNNESGKVSNSIEVI